VAQAERAAALLAALAAACVGCQHAEQRASYLPDAVWHDYKNFYSHENAQSLAIAFGSAGMSANSMMDRDIQEWYRHRAASEWTHGYAKITENLGNGMLVVPAMAAASGLSFASDEGALGTVGQWGERSLRAYAVGGPFLLLSQEAVGGERPKDGDSYWRPFNNCHGVSGHAFIGAVPFITIAEMTDSAPIKVVSYAGSAAVAWARMDRDAHFFSQVFIGWYIAKCSVDSVFRTELRPKPIELVPILDDRTAGAALRFNF